MRQTNKLGLKLFDGTDKLDYNVINENSQKIDDATFGGNVATNDNNVSIYGAVGDGVTDDVEAITRALANSKYVVFDGTKTYAVGSTIVIPADSHVDFRGATIVPLGNHDVIQVKPGSFIENLVVRCTGVNGWDKSAVVLYGGDKFECHNTTKITNVKMYNDTISTDGTTQFGNGLYLYGDNFGDVISGLYVVDVMTNGFGNGILFRGVESDRENQSGGLVFIGANNFRGYWSYMDNCAVNMECEHSSTHITNNIFTDLHIEPNTSRYPSSYGIYCDGFCNYFQGVLYDYFNGHTAIYFGNSSSRNTVKNNGGPINSAWWYVDKGISNKIISNDYEHTVMLPYAIHEMGMLGNQDDALAFIDKRGECTLETLDGTYHYGTLSNVFNPSPRGSLVFTTTNPDTDKGRAIITINCRKAIGNLSHLALQFANGNPKSVKITLYTATEAVVVYDTDKNYNDRVVISTAHVSSYGIEPMYGVAKIVLELGGFNDISSVSSNETTYGWGICRIMAVDSFSTGDTWMRRDGGELYGNVKFSDDYGVVLTSESGKLFKLSVSDSGTLNVTEVQEEDLELPEVATLIPIMATGTTWYNTELAGVEQSAITSIVFNSAYEPTGSEDASWACDEDNNGNIMAYRNGTEIVIKSTTGSDGVKLNPDSSYMFANDGTKASFSALSSITGTETLRANKNTSVSYICNKNTALINPIFIPEGVTEMGYAFSGCRGLTTPPELPEGIMSLANAFASCSALQYLPEIPSTVRNLSYAFHGCSSATKAPSVVPAPVTTMTYAFRLCVKLEGTIEINATNLGSFDSCFDTTARDSNGVVLTGTNTQLAELAATNTQGKVTVASA